jgi:hypothetical protein
MSIRKTPAHRARRRPPFFRPVPLRGRADGWTEERQCGFLVALYASGSVAGAARSLGMTARTVYRLRARPDAESFARAWAHVLTPPGSGRTPVVSEDFRKVALDTLVERVETGLVQPVLYRGKMIAVRRKPDNSALFRLLRRQGLRWNADCPAGTPR